MAALPPIDMIKGCLAAYDIDINGTHEEVHARLGAYLVAVKLGVTPPRASGKRVRPNIEPKAKKQRPTRADWFKFLRDEKDKVKAELGLTDRVSIMKEVARRWKLNKEQGSSSSGPLLITYQGGSDSDSDDSRGLAEVLIELPPDEVRAALDAHGVEADDDHNTNVARLVRVMIA